MTYFTNELNAPEDFNTHELTSTVEAGSRNEENSIYLESFSNRNEENPSQLLCLPGRILQVNLNNSLE